MSWVKRFVSSRKIILSSIVMAIASVGLLLGTEQNASEPLSFERQTQLGGTTFPGAGTGAIPDGLTGTPPAFGAPRDITFAVAGLTGPITAMSVDFTGTHTWVGDVDAVLIAPGGSPTLALVSRIGVVTAGSFGDSSNYAGAYSFADSAAGTNLWTVATNAACGDTCNVAVGPYRTTAPGQTGQTNPPAVTSLLTAFGGLSTAQINGTWTLRFRDAASVDTGTVTAANLSITGGSLPTGLANVDFDGDGRSDFSVARDVSGSFSESSEFFQAGSVREKLRIQKDLASRPELGGPSPVGANIAWFSSGSSNGVPEIVGFGEPATDFIVPNDYDGDGQTDFAVWRSGAPTEAAFYILNSSNSTVSITPFGQTGDDPAITGDYDGDGSADLATYRCPSGADGQCFFFYRGSAGVGNITFVPWGFGQDGDFFVNPGDFDGDGKYDYCIQRSDPSAPTSAQFVLLRSMDSGVEYINWGAASDFILPGDYDGDGRSDFCVRRTVGGNRQHYVLERDGGGTGIFPIFFGIGADTSAPGDYDGDGVTDIAIWRPNADPNQNFFWVRRSSDSAIQVFEWGQQGDIAVAGWNVH